MCKPSLLFPLLLLLMACSSCCADRPLIPVNARTTTSDASKLDTTKVMKGVLRHEDSDDSEKGGRPRTSVRKRKARDVAAAGSSNMTGKISAKSVTRRDNIMLHGFCRSLPEMKKKPHAAIEIVQEVLDKALECKESSDGKFDIHMIFYAVH